MTGRTSPTIVVDEVLGARADDPRFARIDVRMPGNIEAVIALHVDPGAYCCQGILRLVRGRDRR